MTTSATGVTTAQLGRRAPGGGKVLRNPWGKGFENQPAYVGERFWEITGCRVAPLSRGTTPMENTGFHVDDAPESVAEMERLGDEIAELSAHLDAATAHLLDLI